MGKEGTPVLTQEAHKGSSPLPPWKCRQHSEEAKGGGQVGKSREGNASDMLDRGSAAYRDQGHQQCDWFHCVR